MDAIRENFPLLLQGIGTTVALTVIGYALALILGTLLAVARVSPIPPLRGAATVYVEIFRNIPLLSLLILISFGLPDVGLLLPYFWCGVLGLTLSSAAFVCENVRSGINTVPIGHAEAARSIGFGKVRSMLKIVMPQAVKNILPNFGNEFANLIKASSQVMVIGVGELMFTYNTISGTSGRPFLPLLVIALMYFAVTFIVGCGVRAMERHFKKSDR